MKVDPGRDSADAPSRVPLRVLIVEDSSDDALLLLRELEKGGFEPEHERVYTPENMRRALANREPWDVVLSDWQMPRFEAPEALAMLLETNPETPFIIVSGKVGEEAAVEAMKAGAYDYVKKGNLARLCATVERGLQEAQIRREHRRAEEERDRLFEFSPDLLGVAGLDGHFKRVNPAFEETLGYSGEELLARPFVEFVHPEDRAATISELESLGRGVRTAYFENRYLRKDGSEVWLEWKAVPVVEEDAIYATARDVTERKRAEEALRRRDAILRAVAFAAERFLKQATPWQESAQEVLERLGMAAEVSRVYIFENYAEADGVKLPTKRYEWLAPGVPAGADNPTTIDLPDWAADYSRWGEVLGRGELLCGHTREFPQEEQPMLEAEGILSIALVSIFVEGEWWGFIGFDECTGEREWSAAETEALEAAANTLGAAIQRERAEEAIRQSEQLYRTVVEQATEYISLIDAETRRILGSNPAFREALGYSEEELGRMTLYDIVAHDRESIDRNARRVLRKGRYSMGERKHRHRDGSLVDVEVSASALSYGGREVVCVVGRDVTERRRREEELRESQRALATLMSNLPGMAYRCRNDPSWTMEFISAGCLELTGYPPGDLVGNRMRSYGGLIHPDDRDAVWQSVQAALRERRSFRFTYRITTASGDTKWVWEQGRGVFSPEGALLALEGFVTDTTEQVRAERALRESEERFRGTFEQAAVGVAHVSPHGSWLRVNQKLCEIVGYTREELLERTFQDITHPNDLEADLEHQDQLLSGEIPRYSMEKRYLRKDGSAVWINLTTSLGRDPSGEPEYFIAIVEDITERKQVRDALVQSEERYRAVVEQTAEGIFLCDATTGEVLESNTAFRELLGYTAGELRGVRIHDLIGDDPESIDSNLRLILDEGSRFLGERRYRRKDGSLVDVEAAASVISYGGRKVICDVIRDVSERVEAFRMLEERLTALAGISESLTVGQTMEATLDALAAGVVQSTAAVACSVVLMDEESSLFRTAGSHGLPEGYTASLEAAYRAGMRPPPVEVFRTRRPMLVRDARQVALNTPFSSPLHGFLHEVPWDTIYFVPLVSRGRALGVINLYYPAGEEPGDDEKVFLGAVADQTAVAVENARLFAAAQGKAALEERQRLARELHDSVSQALYGIALGSRTAHTLLHREGHRERVSEWLEYVLSLAEAGLTEMRALIFELRPESLETEGLVAALERQAAALRARHEIPVYVALGEEPEELSPEAKEALYRIAQEALHNTVKHAHASRAELRLEREAGGSVALEVSDDGVGFDPEEDFSGHLGLKSMGERVGRLGGELRVESAPGEGTTIHVRIRPAT